MNKEELRKLFSVAYKHNRHHHLALVVGFWHGLRVSEVTRMEGTQVFDGKLTVQRLKGSKKTTQALHFDKDPLFDESPLVELAKNNQERLFPWTQQAVDKWIKKYARLAGIMADLLPGQPGRRIHFHTLKHSCAMVLWDATKSLGKIQSHLGHDAPSSTMVYLMEGDKRAAEEAMASITI